MRHYIRNAVLGLAMMGLGVAPSLAGEADTATPSNALAANDVELHDAWMRETPAEEPAGAYVTIENKGPRADRLLFVTGPAVNYVDIQRGKPSRDAADTVTPLDSLDIPAGATVALEPGQTRLIVHGFEGALTRGATLFLIFHFEHAGDISAYFSVKATDATGPGNENDSPREGHGSGMTKGA